MCSHITFVRGISPEFRMPHFHAFVVRNSPHCNLCYPPPPIRKLCNLNFLFLLENLMMRIIIRQGITFALSRGGPLFLSKTNLRTIGHFWIVLLSVWSSYCRRCKWYAPSWKYRGQWAIYLQASFRILKKSENVKQKQSLKGLHHT